MRQYTIPSVKKLLYTISGLIIAVLMAYIISSIGLLTGLVFLLIAFGLTYFIICLKKPVVALFTLFIYCFFIFALDRYIVKGSFPAGILVDLLIIYTYIIAFLKSFFTRIEWENARDAPILIFIVWLLYCITTLFNPESPGIEGWIIGMRPILYMILTVPLFCVFLHQKQINIFFLLWCFFSIILTLKGFIQLNIGLDAAERQTMMSAAMRRTHLLHGKLRIFSLLSDAGQFGAQQAHAGLCGAILFLGEKNKFRKFLYFLMCITGIYGMFISGTRGAMFVLITGGMMYLILVKNIKLLTLGAIVGGLFVYFMMFTYIGQDNYNIRRMRTAFRPDKDASFQVRKNNQQILKEYLATRPFGGGIGAMRTGKSGTVLGDIPPDSGLVMIWGEQGIVGLCLFLSIFVYILLKGTYEVWFRIKNEWLRNVLIAMICGIGGISVANYGNSVIFQHPTNILISFSIALIFSAYRIDKELENAKKADCDEL